MSPGDRRQGNEHDQKNGAPVRGWWCPNVQLNRVWGLRELIGDTTDANRVSLEKQKPTRPSASGGKCADVGRRPGADAVRRSSQRVNLKLQQVGFFTEQAGLHILPL